LNLINFLVCSECKTIRVHFRAWGQDQVRPPPPPTTPPHSPPPTYPTRPSTPSWPLRCTPPPPGPCCPTCPPLSLHHSPPHPPPLPPCGTAQGRAKRGQGGMTPSHLPTPGYNPLTTQDLTFQGKN